MYKSLALAVSLLFVILSCRESQKDVQDAPGPPEILSSEHEDFKVGEKDGKTSELTYSQRKGKRLYVKYCAICHGLQGRGDGFNAYNLQEKPKDYTEGSYLESVTDAWLVETISQGGRGVKRSVLMPSYENSLSRQQIEDVVAYVRFLSSGKP